MMIRVVYLNAVDSIATSKLKPFCTPNDNTCRPGNGHKIDIFQYGSMTK